MPRLNPMLIFLEASHTRARAAVQRDAAAASAGAGPVGERGHPRRARAAERHPRHGRRDRRHVGHDGPRAAAVLHGAVARSIAGGARRHAAQLRLQARRSGRRRPGVRRAMPAQPALRAGAAAADRARPRGGRVHGEGRVDARVHGSARGVPALRHAALRRGGEELPDRRRRLHGRAPPVGDDCRAAAAGAGRHARCTRALHRDITHV